MLTRSRGAWDAGARYSLVVTLKFEDVLCQFWRWLRLGAGVGVYYGYASIAKKKIIAKNYLYLFIFLYLHA